jgi:sulfite exporter TauE/SafE
MFDSLIRFAAWCGGAGVHGPAIEGGIALGMLLAGLAASPLHCAPMCGGFVLGQVSDRMARLPAARLSECQRLRASALTPYHLGRLTTYSALGFAAGGGGLAIGHLGLGTGVFLLVGAVLLVLQAAQRLRPAFALPLARRVRGYPMGLALGFLPCGVLYAALAAAAATGAPLTGALAMLCFGLGTVPSLVVVGLFGAAGGHRFRARMTALTPAILLFNAGLLAVLGVKMLAGS